MDSQQKIRKKTARWSVASALFAAGAILIAGSAYAQSSQENLGLRTAGTVIVTYPVGYMPYAGETANGTLTGLEGQLFLKATEDLGLNVQVRGVKFPALLAGIQGGRYDIGIGGIGWSAKRAQTGVFTDPVYYSPITTMCQPGIKVASINEMHGQSIGVVTGTLQAEGIRSIPEVNIKTYPNSQAAIADLASGRLDCIAVDALTVAYIRKKRPDLHGFPIYAVQPPTEKQLDKNPKLSQLEPYQVVWYCSKRAEKLCALMTTKIRNWYHDGTLKAALEEWGIDDPKMFMMKTKALQNERIGVDRPKGWIAPSN